jgi:hypothetical protein
MSEPTRRRAIRTFGLLGLVGGGLLLLPHGHPVLAHHTYSLTLQAVQDHIDDLTAALAALTPATCGNGELDPGEACDGTTPITCGSLGFGPGAIPCTAACTLDTSGCSYEEPSPGVLCNVAPPGLVLGGVDWADAGPGVAEAQAACESDLQSVAGCNPTYASAICSVNFQTFGDACQQTVAGNNDVGLNSDRCRKDLHDDVLAMCVNPNFFTPICYFFP